jgi:hypothetical protein
MYSISGNKGAQKALCKCVRSIIILGATNSTFLKAEMHKSRECTGTIQGGMRLASNIISEHTDMYL